LIIIEFIFFASIFIIVYGYILYPLILATMASMTGVIDRKCLHKQCTVSVIIAVFDEEKNIVERINNILSSNYPAEYLEVIVASDGSTDATVEIAGRYESKKIKVVECKERMGRAAVHNHAIKYASGEIILFTDAETKYHPDCIKNLVNHYDNEKIGCVGGMLISRNFNKNSLGVGQGAYWKFEYFMREMQSRLGILTKVSGANMSIRKSLYKNVPEGVDIDQIAGFDVILQGYKVVYDKSAVAYETFAIDLSSQLRSRQRFVIQSLNALSERVILLNPFKYPAVAWNIVSYRIFRYLVPFLLVILFILNIVLLHGGAFFIGSLCLQLLFYVFASIGLVFRKKDIKVKFLSIPFSFCCFEYGVMLGLFGYLFGRKVSVYNKGQ
jgi:poly-beta-1,6-N-acetyl-D-glucosamine synthase